MIIITNDGTKLAIKVETKIECHQLVIAHRECQDVLFAKLLADRLRNDLENTIEWIRKEEYNRGWKDARTKKATKKQYFFTSLKKII